MLIGLSGKMGSGKTTLTNYLTKELEHTYDIVHEKVAKDLYDIQNYIYKKCKLKLKGEKDRPLLIAVGEWGRDITPSLWTDLCFDRVRELMKDKNKLIIIDDIRYPEEANALEECGGILIRIEGTQRGPNINPEFSNRGSEIALDNYPFKHRISNLGTTEETLAQLEEILKQYNI